MCGKAPREILAFRAYDKLRVDELLEAALCRRRAKQPTWCAFNDRKQLQQTSTPSRNTRSFQAVDETARSRAFVMCSSGTVPVYIATKGNL